MLRILLKFILWMASTAMLLALLGTVGFYYFLKTEIEPNLPPIDTLKEVRMQVPLRIYSADGKLMSEYGEKKRIPLRYAEIPQQLVKAFLAAEDDRFFEHPGVDYQGLVRAGLQVVLTGRRSQGGSTITMQVARNFFLSNEKTYSRKLNEIVLALRIDHELSKEEVLELYLNKIYLGNRAYGVGAAAQIYYGKAVNDLSLAEAAMIAGLPKAPSTMNPIVNPDRAMLRRNYVLGRMRELGHITEQEYQQASQAANSAVLHSVQIELDAPYLSEMVRAEVFNRFGQDAYNNGYRVTTTIDSRLQEHAVKAIRENLHNYDLRHGYLGAEGHVEALGDSEEGLIAALSKSSTVGDLLPALVVAVQEKSAQVYIKGLGLATIPWEGISWARKWITEDERGKAPKSAREVLVSGDLIRVRQLRDEQGGVVWHLSQIPKLESALVSIDPDDGALKALVGGFDFYRSKFNRATQARRQPGSGFKPMIYSAALEAGFTAATLINDAPIVFDDQIQITDWRPENYTGKFGGPTRFRKALAESRNLVSIRILRDIGVKYASDYARNFGFGDSALPPNLSLALGTGVVAPWDMARSYCVFANGGFAVEPYFIQRIEVEQGGVVFQAEPAKACRGCEEDSAALAALSNPAKRVITPQNHYLMNSILRDVVSMGTATKAKVLGRKDLAGKTGTTNDQRDAWFNGFHPHLVTVVWMGFDDSGPLGKKETGGEAALPAWIAYMREALRDVPEEPLEMPGGMYQLRISPETGQPAPPEQKKAIMEAFQIGSSPGTVAPGDAASGEGVSEGGMVVPPGSQPVESVSPDLF